MITTPADFEVAQSCFASALCYGIGMRAELCRPGDGRVVASEAGMQQDTACAERIPSLRVVVFTRTWLSSGAGLFAQELVGSMVDAGASVTFVAPAAEDPRFEVPRPGLRRVRPPRELRDGASRPARALASLARVMCGAAALLALRPRHRLFVVTIPDPLVFALPLLLLLRITGARVVFVAHDPVPHAWRLPPRWRALEVWAHGACYWLAAAVVVLSEPSRAKLAEVYPRVSTPVRVIEHGVFVLGAPTPLPGTGLLLLFGTLRRNKGILQAIEGSILAAREGAPVRLVVAGEPYREEPEYWRACEAAAASAPGVIDMRVGYVPDRALRVLFAEVDALLMPYDQFFSQSGVALLAASNGRPVVATRAGGLGALMAEGMPTAEVAFPVTARSVADAILAFFRTPADVWREHADRYRAVTLEKRSWRVIGRNYVALLRELEQAG